jgi:hypothetical protein
MRCDREACRRRGRLVGAWAAALVLLSAGVSRAQVYQAYFPNAMFQYGSVGYPIVWPYYGGIPVAGFYDNPYYWWQQWAYADTLAMAQDGLGQAAFNVASMEADSASSARSLVASNMLALAAASAPPESATAGLYNINTGRARFGGGSGGARLVDMTSRDGNVLWPLFAPTAGDLLDRREAANAAIRDVMGQLRGSGRVAMDPLNKALGALQGYAEPALDHLRREDPRNVSAFSIFVRDLDRGLRGLAGGTSRQASDTAAAPRSNSPPPPPAPGGAGQDPRRDRP